MSITMIVRTGLVLRVYVGKRHYMRTVDVLTGITLMNAFLILNAILPWELIIGPFSWREKHRSQVPPSEFPLGQLLVLRQERKERSIVREKVRSFS